MLGYMINLFKKSDVYYFFFLFPIISCGNTDLQNGVRFQKYFDIPVVEPIIRGCQWLAAML